MIAFPLKFGQNIHTGRAPLPMGPFLNGNALAGPGAGQAWSGAVPVLQLASPDQAALSAEASDPTSLGGEMMSNFLQAWALPGQAGSGEATAQLQQALMMLAQILGMPGLTDGSQAAGGVPFSPQANANFGGPSAPLGGGGGAGGGGGRARVGGGGGSSGGGSVSSSSGSAGSAPISTVPPELAGDDKLLAQFIESELKGTPLAGQGLGSHFVKAGRDNQVDPLALMAISRHETQHGELGVGVTKHMGVGAYDSNPNGKTKFDGAVQQIYSGAKTFANLRKKGGSNEKAPIAQQLSAVNRGGWATDKNWHNGVGKHYSDIAKSAKASVPSEPKKSEKSEGQPETASV